MPLKQFRNDFSGDMNAVLLESINSRLQAAQVAAMPPPRTSAKRSDTGLDPGTVLPTARKRKPRFVLDVFDSNVEAF